MTALILHLRGLGTWSSKKGKNSTPVLSCWSAQIGFSILEKNKINQSFNLIDFFAIFPQYKNKLQECAANDMNQF